MTPEDAVAFVRAEPPRYPPGTILLRMTLRPESHTFASFWADPKNGCQQGARLAKLRAPKRIPLSGIVATQKRVNREQMVVVLTDPTARARPVLVLARGRKFWLVDGHHRAYALKLLGQKSVLAHVVVLENS